MWKRLSSVVLSVIMLCVMITCGPVNPIGADVEETLVEESIVADEEKEVAADKNAEDKCYKFIPEESGMYIYTSQNGDIKGYITDESGKVLITSSNHDESGYNYFSNFELKYNFTAGKTYYLCSKSYGSEEGTYSVTIKKIPLAESIYITLPDECGIGVSRESQPQFLPDETSDTIKTWESDNQDILTVDENGRIFGKAIGKATITVMTENGLTASKEITVVDNQEIKADESLSIYSLAAENGYKFVPEADGEYRIGVKGENWGTYVKVYDQLLETVSQTQNAIYELTAGETYYIITPEYGYHVNSIKVFVETINKKTDEPTESPTPTDTPIATIIGDINLDTKVNAKDALLILKHAAKLEILNQESISIADVNEDKSVDAKDALLVLMTAAGIKN